MSLASLWLGCGDEDLTCPKCGGSMAFFARDGVITKKCLVCGYFQRSERVK